MENEKESYELRQRNQMVEMQPGSPNFDGSAAYEAFLDAGGYQAHKIDHKNGYAPQPPSPAMPTWKPEFTAEEKKAHDQYVIDNRLPF